MDLHLVFATCNSRDTMLRLTFFVVKIFLYVRRDMKFILMKTYYKPINIFVYALKYDLKFSLNENH